MLYEVYICTEDHELKEPYFSLPVIENDASNSDELITKNYKATFSLLNTQEGYARLYTKVFDAITTYDERLKEWSPTILYYTLLRYHNLAEIDFEQYYLPDSHSSLRFASPLADIFKSYLNDKERVKAELLSFKERNINPRGSSPKRLTLDIGSKPYKFEDPAFVEWVLDVLKKAIIDGSYPFGFGWNFNELSGALSNNSIEQLEALISLNANEQIIDNSEFISYLCISIHQLVCAILGQDVNKYSNDQLELYGAFLSLFKIDRFLDYNLKGLKGAERKRIADKFRVLLKRHEVRHSHR
ncbi:MAG: hypothetical protein EOO43_02410 [Flavobacterium sp.]|nr:MAG: hypothetical protein EOO43_02410 [Flavobacterium sp.]